MAEGALFDVAKGITEKVGNLVPQQIGSLWSLKDEIEKLGDTVLTISAVLLDAEEKQQHNYQVEGWLKKLNDAFYEADNLLDDICTEASRQEVMTRNKKAKEVHIFFSKSNQLAYGFKMRHKVKAMRERLDAIKNYRGFHLDELPVEIQVGNYRVRETHSFVRSEEVIGRDKDKVEIKKILLDPNVEGNVSILPIVGLGGLGKTTLAQYVFNDKEIQSRFEQKFWVCVSDDFDVKVIVKKILECAQNKKPENLEMNTMINDLKKEVDGKRYLLALDDVWNEDPHNWLQLKDLLMGGARGSRILVTTRSNRVAEITRTVQPYILEGLDDEKSWSLFKWFASVEGEDLENSYKRAIGKEILESCDGVPLAIRTIGSILYFKNSEKEWLSFKDNELSEIPQEENDILPTLKLSYDHLPSYLKQCFAYCCLFPKDYKIHKPTLIQMWIAQGFIRPLNQNQCLEDVGHKYFMDLLWRSFFKEVEKDKFGNILYFKIPNLMHDLAKSIAGSKYLTIYSKEKSIDEKTLHVSFGGLLASQIPVSLFKASRIRTFMLQGQLEIMDKSIYSAIVKSFKFIFLLDLHNIGIQTVPTYISNLKHLRYLDLSYNSCIEMLPNSITKLQNLQTLRLSGCSKLKELPKDIKNLVNLRYLEIDKCEDLTHIPLGLGQLTNLRTLSKFVSSSVSRHNGGLEELHRLDGLRGTLEIWGLRHGKDAELECMAANLKNKEHLQGLGLKWFDVYKQDVVYDEMSLEALQPHPNLQQLCITLYMGVRFPSWLLSLKNLVEFSLFNCNRCPHLPPLDQLQSLKSLFLSGLDSLEYVSQRKEFSNSSFFPYLEELTLSYCPNLKGWWQQLIRDSIEESSTIDNNLQPSLPRLSKVCIWGCPKLTSVPLFPLDQIPSLKVLELGSLLALEYISNNREFSNSSFFPSLEELKLKYCPNLKGWWRRQRESMEEVNEGDDKNVGIATATVSMAKHHLMPSFPQLSKLCIWRCPKLVSMPLFPFVEKLELYDCSFEPLEQTTRIATTAVASTSSFSTHATSFAPLSKLLSMEIGHMEEPLLEASMHNLISLNRLWIYECRGPLLQGIQHLTALKQLDICSSEVFESSNDGNGVEWQGLQSLSSLWLFQLLKLESLPVGIQHIAALQILTIDYCPCLMALPEWISNLTSLEILEILQCPKLRSLPMGISHLKFLHTLKIRYCPILLQRCKKTGNDWPKIAHIPNLYLEEGISDGEPNEQQKKLDLLRIRA